MITNKPSYFDAIQQKTTKRWQQLEADHELAAPWHQLFKQVQSPRHVLSELLQNADDAEATEVSVKIENGVFSFTHNGKDFSEDDFASLCRFGYSNKRLLRTIGFRGIGFKSTFSLGNTVELRSPTLTVEFNKRQFTLPVWSDGNTTKDGNTKIIVRIEDEQRKKELVNNLQEWLSSPFSLLFFNNIRHLKLGDHDLQWDRTKKGPTPGSEWMSLQGDHGPYLIVRSSAEPFPEDALKEIREERLLEMGETTELAPCKVEIVLGAPGQLFVVLPTGVNTGLPFAINAPFVQDPARLKIKDPEISPTNRWLLRRVGKLVAETMITWLTQENLPEETRAKAYDLLPGDFPINDTLESACMSVIEEAISDTLQERDFVLADGGLLKPSGQCTSVPAVIRNIWTSDQIISILGTPSQQTALLSSYVEERNGQKLLARKAIKAISPDDFRKILSIQTPPKPANWAPLLELWSFVSRLPYSWKNKELNIFPVRGKDILLSAKNVVRLGEKRLLQSEDDWDFLARFLLVLDVNWTRYLTEQRRVSEENHDKELAAKTASAESLLANAELDKPSNVDSIIERMALVFFSENQPTLNEAIRIAQIAAKLNAKIGSNFRFWTRDGRLQSISDVLFFDETGRLEEFIPPQIQKSAFLHREYSTQLISCTAGEWLDWIYSGLSGINTFPPITKNTRSIWGDKNIEKEVKSRGYTESLYYQYKTEQYEIEDLDFAIEYWEHWEACAQEDPTFWGRLIDHLLNQRKTWESALTARVFHVATTGSRRTITTTALAPKWVIKLNELPCLRDTRGNYRQPAELMLRTPETEPLMDVEPFVDARLDTEASRPLLKMLGVRNTPSGPKQILERLRALAQATKPPVMELAKWYQRLDALFEHCSTSDQQDVVSIFQNEALIFTEDGTWQTSGAVYIIADENDAPGAALIHSSVNHLSLWRRIYINERPTIELAVQWLNRLPSNEKIPAGDYRRVKALLGRHPVRIFRECGHWLNLAGAWAPFNELHFSLSMQSLIPWGHFHDWVKEETADFQMLSAEMVREVPFASLLSLASQVENRIQDPPKVTRQLSAVWLQSLGRTLSRIRLDDESMTQKIRTLAQRLSQSKFVQVDSIHSLPYLRGLPAGSIEAEQFAWVDQTLFLVKLSPARMARLLQERLGALFGWNEIGPLVLYSFERSDREIRAYIAENFDLDPEEDEVGKQPSADQEDIAPARPMESANEALPAEEVRMDAPAEEATIPFEEQEDQGNVKSGESEGDEIVKPIRPIVVKPPIIERFAQAQGFRKDGAQVFVHPNGGRLARNIGTFPWLREDNSGVIIKYYWAKEHCLERKPLEIPTEIWHLIEESPEKHALILEDSSGAPVEIDGVKLQELKQQATLKIYPAAYRLVLEMD